MDITFLLGKRGDNVARIIKDKKNDTEKISCKICKKELSYSNFYNTKSKFFPSGKVDICKPCIKGMIDYNNIETIYNILRQLDIPFIYSYWEIAINGKSDAFGSYIRMANSMPQLEGLKWKDSSFKKDNNDLNDDTQNNNTIENINISNYDLEQLKEKFGHGYPDSEYILFEKKYQQLRPSIQLLTTMHDEFFREYCVDKVKETLAKSKGDFKEAKEWSLMAKDAATSGKLNPSQMSKADLSGGLDTFGQLVRAVEQEVDIIPLLPKFIEKPKDKVDVVIWHFINYVRDLKGLPTCEYKDIYEFYEKRRSDYENQMIDNETNMNSSKDDFEGDIDV